MLCSSSNCKRVGIPPTRFARVGISEKPNHSRNGSCTPSRRPLRPLLRAQIVLGGTVPLERPHVHIDLAARKTAGYGSAFEEGVQQVAKVFIGAPARFPQQLQPGKTFTGGGDSPPNPPRIGVLFLHLDLLDVA